MPLKESKGNMYPWVTHTHCHLSGECPHKCTYCYVDNPRFGRPKRYQGPIGLIGKEFEVNYGSGKTIFIENCNDMFAIGVPDSYIDRIIQHCLDYPDNTYVFQTKNPFRYHVCSSYLLPTNSILGATIETNRNTTREISMAPGPIHRALSMALLGGRKFLTIEPILDFDVNVLSQWMDMIRPEFVNIGADSKGHGLPEPTADKVDELIEKLKGYGIEVREKRNLGRLRK